MRLHDVFLAIGLIGALAAAPVGAEPRHGIAMHGEPALAPGFQHLPYANPAAPKGGTLKLATTGSFDSTNPFIVMGQAVTGASLMRSMVGMTALWPLSASLTAAAPIAARVVSSMVPARMSSMRARPSSESARSTTRSVLASPALDSIPGPRFQDSLMTTTFYLGRETLLPTGPAELATPAFMTADPVV